MPRTKKDRMLSNYQYSYDKEKNPYDFLKDPETGLRPGQKDPPKGIMVTTIIASVGITEHSTFPPLAIWDDGQWMSEMPDDTFTGTHPPESDAFDTWVVSGEGTPGNFEWRLYTLPSEFSRHNLSNDMKPKHPLLWPKSWRQENKQQNWRSNWASSGWSSGTTQSSTSSKLPYGVRIRCTKCGHWFRADDLAGHVECCPQVNEFSDWAIGCECCDSMDDTVKVKDGFPREMYGAKEVTANGDSAAATERPPGDFVDAPGGDTAG